MRTFTLLLCFIFSISSISAQSKNLKAILLNLPKSNYKLISQKEVYAKDTIITRDFDNDSVEEQIFIGKNHPNGFRILGIQNHYGYDLCPTLYNTYTNPIDEFGELSEDFYIQISWFDLDDDKKEELIVSVGDKVVTSFTVIYKIRKSNTLPFVKVAQIDGQGRLYLTNDKEIIAPYGSQYLCEVYKMENGRLKIIR